MRAWSRVNKLVPLALHAVMLVLLAVPTNADTVALQFTGGETGGFLNITLGWSFSVSTPITLTKLGIWSGLGLSGHTVTLWTNTGTAVAQATVDNTGTVLDDFTYVSV